MAESYFELLTEQSGIPAKPFDPVGEIKRLRQRLALRLSDSEPDNQDVCSDSRPDIHLAIRMAPPPIAETSEPATLESVIQTVNQIKKTLTVRKRSRSRRRLPLPSRYFQRAPSFHVNRPVSDCVPLPSVVAQYFTAPHSGALETMNVGLMAMGMIAVVFGILSFCRGWENDFSLGALVSVAGLSVTVIGFGGRFLASRAERW